ncbi:glycosyl hydrolase family 76-domain-containing protein [Rhypophila decipiens]|uniref:Glycosyl hydrolase family 76-domain-containing protein n=1 Tax=Rhypophila decipiens TaxID=261697 RepID=A0AAN7B857_9PEZI|nr:glycosyl hydrolase family 76-domain-containing protein [Rhypophila decipiens]
MVSTKWGGFAARAALLVSSRLSGRADQATSVANTLSAVKTLQVWYSEQTGLWETTGWWNSANCLTVLADWALADRAGASSVNVPKIMATTFSNAQTSGGLLTTTKNLSDEGMPTSHYNFHRDELLFHNNSKRSALEARGFSGFLNEFYDDEGWWALAWIRSWDVTKQPEYLDMAERIFEDMKNGTDGTCGGGIWWSKEKRYKNAIANELYLSVSASLANRIPTKKAYYLAIAQEQWTWFQKSGMINSQNLINDGLTFLPDGITCVNNNLQTWSYNQGVILGGLVELARATGDRSLLDKAVAIAQAALSKLADEKGIIHEIDRCEPNCGDDGAQFKGVFVRNLRYLARALDGRRPAGRDTYGFEKVIDVNAESIWTNDRNERGELGVTWAGPVEGGPETGGRGPTAGSHSSAMDVLVADIVGGGW